MNTPRLTGLIVFLSLTFTGGLLECLSQSLRNGSKIYLSGVLLPLPEKISHLDADQRRASFRTGERPDRQVLLGFMRFQGGDDQPQPASTHAGETAFWTLLTLILLVFAGYVLFQVRKRRAAESRIRALQQHVGVLFDKAPCGYHSVNEDGTLINVNDTLLQWLGYQKDEVLNRLKFSELVIGDPAETARKIETISAAGAGEAYLTLAKKNGEELPVIVSCLYTAAEDTGKSERLFSTVNNKRCHDALERMKTLDQELEAFSYSISHDLRAPLRSIDGYSRILQEDYADKLDDEGKRVLAVVMNNAKRMGKLIDDLLDFGRLGRKAIHYSKVNMSGIVQSIVADLKAQEPTRNIRVEVDDLVPALGDADMLRQVWHNLLENAVKYTGKTEHASIEVHSYTTTPNEVCYEVKDNGVGFDMQYADKLFGIFQRLHKMQDFSGTGVGLAIVKRIITRHGGRVWANGSLRGGATFSFTLPAEDESK